jgi:glycosyltransferase involved in cell wall biosynthesis
VEVEHIIQDAGTGPELDTWIHTHTKAKLFVEKDNGMYDAVNRGMDRATGDILAFLNCDEQYLPGTLAAVAKAFEENPDTDVIVGDFLIVDGKAQLRTFRKVTKVRRLFVKTCTLYAYTCATFFRRRVWESGLRYRPDLKDIADALFVVGALERGFRFRNVRQYLSIFTDTGENRSVGEIAKAEGRKWFATFPWWERTLTPVFKAVRRVEKLLIGGYHSGPIGYDVYASDDAETRSHIVCEKPTGVYQQLQAA